MKFKMHKEAGKLRATCRKVERKEDIPQFLITAGAVKVNDSNSVTMIAVEGPATRQFPFFLSWEETTKLQCGYGAWPKDNGFTTLVVDEEGRCYDKAPNVTAALLVYGEDLPEPFSKMDRIEIADGKCRVHTSWGEVREAPIPQKDGEYTAVLVDYGDGSVNLLTLTEKSAEEYIVVGDDGQDIGKLVDLIGQL